MFKKSKNKPDPKLERNESSTRMQNPITPLNPQIIQAPPLDVNDICSILTNLTCIPIPVRDPKKAILSSDVIVFKEFCNKIESLISHIQNFITKFNGHSNDFESYQTWVSFFCVYPRTTSKNPITVPIDKIYNALNAFSELAPEVGILSKLSLVRVFLDFLKKHCLDPCSFMIGLEASDEAVNTCISLFGKKLENESPVPAEHAASFSSLFNVFDSQTEPLKFADIANKILKWSLVDDGPELIKQVRSFSVTLKGVDKLNNGDIIIVKLYDNPEKFVFGRFKELVDAHAHVYVVPDESQVLSICAQKILPLNFNIKHKIFLFSKGNEPLTRLVSYIKLPQSFSKIDALAKEKCQSFFFEKNIDIEKMQAWVETKSCVDNWLMYRDALKVLETIHYTQEYRKLVDNYESMAKDAVVKYIEENENKFHPLARANEIKIIREMNCRAFIEGRIKQIKCIPETVQVKLGDEIKDILNGVKKRQLTEWWLATIGSKVTEFLERIKGFVNSAVPENYTDEPPPNLFQVKINLVILQDVLNKQNDKYKVQEFLGDVRDEIYPKINGFEKIARITIGYLADIDNLIILSDDFKILEESVKKSDLNHLEQEKKKQLMDLLEDIKYLWKMQRMERPELNEEKNFHIVPITGLVMSEFIRRENECKTVVELWRPPPDFDINKRDEKGRTQLHNAICEKKYSLVVVYLAEKTADINAQDNAGWTLLHTAAHYKEPQIFEHLLYRGSSLNIANNDGNTPLHYLAANEIKSADDSCVEYRLLKKLLATGADPNLANNNGETPLHKACMKVNPIGVRALLEAKADPNLLSKQNSTPLHYVAPMPTKIESLRLLLDFGADPNIVSGRGSCIEIATNTKNLDAVTLCKVAAERLKQNASSPSPSNNSPSISASTISSLNDIGNEVDVKTQKKSKEEPKPKITKKEKSFKVAKSK
eukprot:TRINITY_DN3746_c1_g1_i1.p1 TRINITY_DN3746_c1_g1~~TRINITY_DN3746_c1_g1_i1.p1  ORF type:complete len:937 (+),score=349.49 TRINITY_DN3746_c1_g1_i1:148-2958(+)